MAPEQLILYIRDKKPRYLSQCSNNGGRNIRTIYVFYCNRRLFLVFPLLAGPKARAELPEKSRAFPPFFVTLSHLRLHTALSSLIKAGDAARALSYYLLLLYFFLYFFFFLFFFLFVAIVYFRRVLFHNSDVLCLCYALFIIFVCTFYQGYVAVQIVLSYFSLLKALLI